MQNNQPTIMVFSNPPTKSPFAPRWEFTMFEMNILDRLNVENTKKVILENEKTLIAKYKYISDWGTGLGEDSVTSRSNYYNLLEFEELSYLRGIIRDTHDTYLSGIGLPIPEEIYVQCWCNVIRNGQQIGQHYHSSNPYTYLGGHITVQTENTNTNYVSPMTKEVFPSVNIPGKITLFPNWVEHFTDVYSGDSERITIAFDIITKQAFDEDLLPEKRGHWFKL